MSVPKIGEIPDDTLARRPRFVAGIWRVKEDLLEGLADGYDLAELTDREHPRRTALPPGALGTEDIDKAAEAASELWQAATERGYDRQRMRPFRGTVAAGGMFGRRGQCSAEPDAGPPVHRHLLQVEEQAQAEGVRRIGLPVGSRTRAYLELAELLGKRDPDKGGHLAVTFGPIRGGRRRAPGPPPLSLLAGLVALCMRRTRASAPAAVRDNLRLAPGGGPSQERILGSLGCETRGLGRPTASAPRSEDTAHTMLLESAISIRRSARRRAWRTSAPASGARPFP